MVIGEEVNALVVSLDSIHSLLLYPPHARGSLFSPSRLTNLLTSGSKWKQSMRIPSRDATGADASADGGASRGDEAVAGGEAGGGEGVLVYRSYLWMAANQQKRPSVRAQVSVAFDAEFERAAAEEAMGAEAMGPR